MQPLLGKLAVASMKTACSLAKNMLVPLGTMVLAYAINGVIQRKVRGRGVVRVGKWITLVIFNEDTDDIIKIVKLTENSDDKSEMELFKQKNKEQEIRGLISWYVTRNSGRFNVRKYLNWRSSHDSWKRCCKSRKKI